MTLPLITLDLLAGRRACADGVADFARACPNGLDPNNRAAVVVALRAGLGRWWRWARVEGLVSDDLARANLTDANLTRADLSSANLSSANLSGADLSGARYTADTVWPAGFDPATAGAILEVGP